jgi:glycosyltransferase involved in cell wall biosynthesis
MFTYSSTHDDYLLFLGRLVPDKGLREAVRIARATNERLVIIGQLLPEDRSYFNRYVKPYLNDRIVYLGHKPHQETVPYYQKAKALLMPIQWEEPFGVTMIEAMACGTPVVALRRGSVPEVIIDQKTGFIADSLGQMIAQVAAIPTISRLACRKHVLDNFSLPRMAEGYEAAFEAIRAQNTLLQIGSTLSTPSALLY